MQVSDTGEPTFMKGTEVMKPMLWEYSVKQAISSGAESKIKYFPKKALR